MRNNLKYTALGIVTLLLCSFAIQQNQKPSTKYKCMMQLTNYRGEGAYVAVSLLNKEGKFVKTLYIIGDDEEWYPDIRAWWKGYKKNKTSLDGITGATISGGERTVFAIEIEDEMINSGHQIRFETAVEDLRYHKEDLQFELTSESVKGKFEGTGYVRYVKMIPNK